MLQLRTIEAMYESSPLDSVLRWFLVHLCVWGVKEELQPTEDAPQDMLRELVTEFQKGCDPALKSPLMDVWIYCVMDELGKNCEMMEAPVVQKVSENWQSVVYLKTSMRASYSRASTRMFFMAVTVTRFAVPLQ